MDKAVLPLSRRADRPAPVLCRLAVLACALAATGAQAQGAGSAGRAWVITPGASVSQTLTDNALLNDNNKRGDAITLLTAGIGIAHRGERLQGSLDYQLSGSIHARESKGNTTSNNLRAAFKAELVDNWFFLDGGASIGQQTISAFGLQSSDPAFDNPNRTEVRSFTLTPSLRGMIGSWARYDARLSHTQQSAAAGQVGDLTGQDASVTISSAGGGRLGWNLLAARSRDELAGGRTSTTDSLRGGLSYQPAAGLRLSANAGREDSNVITAGGSSHDTWGVGLDWQPSPRTSLSLQRDRRYFGDGHRISFQTRLARSIWRFSSSRDASANTPAFVTTGVSTVYDLLFDSLAVEQPDPALRQQLVLQRLAALGIDPRTTLSTGFLSSAVSLVNRQELGVALQGVRTTLAMSVYRSDTQRLDSNPQVPDDLSLAARIRQQGFTFTLGHRLTPSSGVSLSLAQQRTRGDLGSQSTELQSVNLNWTTSLGRHSNLSLGARHIVFDSVSSPYTENAIFATLGVRF